ncbi:HAD-IA family hydrolase [Paenibacillus sp. WQ 127069]|uniref:Phosphoserine phosphatase n=1 Tax=Paenibacillus baimaensis TaxID=2982185 RepID=A0ABT2UTU3_9BACL|nr:HAD-IA family hydrolase [Paenibacillus sp. WQ 127069]MCU6798062.1 HAD-IA family hydrolase [Paenibacillus sp. WQ 127069]
MAIKAVLFDLDDTLLWDDRSVKEAFQATCLAAAEQVEVDPIELEQAVRQEARKLYESYDTFAFTKMIGINPFEGLWANFTEGDNENFRKLEQLAPQYRTESWTLGLKALGIDDAKLGYELGERFPMERRSRPIVYEETFEVLDQLKGSYKLLLLTNGSPDLQKEKLAGVPELAPYFDHIVISGNHGEGKPATSIFNHALDLLQVTADEAVMIGDKLTTDILGSNRINMRNMWINRHALQRDDEIIPAYEIVSLRDIQGVIDSISS